MTRDDVLALLGGFLIVGIIVGIIVGYGLEVDARNPATTTTSTPSERTP